MPSVGRAVWSLLLLVPGACLIGVSYGTALVGLLLVGAALVTVLLFLLGVRIGVSRWATGLLCALLLVLLAYLVGAGPDGSLRATLGDAIPRLLTAPRPLPITGSLLSPALLLVGTVALLVALRLTAARRDAVSPVVAGVVLYTAGALLSSGQGDRHGLLMLLLAAIALVGWAMVDGPVRPGAALRAVRPLVLLAVPAFAVLVAYASMAPRVDAFEPRELVTPPVQELAASSPLPQLAAWNEHPAAELFRVSGNRYPLRLVTLTTYDGDAWRAGTRYRPLGGFESADLPPGEQRVRMEAKVRLVDLEGPWLPSIGTPDTVSDPAALIDPETGSTVVPGRSPSGFSYEIAGVLDAPSDDVLPSAVVPTGDDVAGYLAVPGLPVDLKAYGEQATKDVRTPYGTAKAIEKAVQGGRSFNPKSVGGSSYFRLQQFLLGKKGTTGAQQGTSEQFATAFAVLARAQGLPTRIVVGFRPGTETGTGPGAGAGERSVRGSDAFAWPEVYFEGPGWVPFSPTPESGGFTQPDPAQEAPNADESVPPGGDVRSPDGPSGETTDRPGSTARDAASLAPLAAAVAGGVLLLLLAALVIARLLRRRRHRAAGATGAWQEVLDAARLSGVPVERTVPATQTAARIERRTTSAGAVGIAHRAERAAFAPDSVHDDTIWDVAVTTSRSLRRTLPWWRRALWHLDPRALRRRR